MTGVARRFVTGHPVASGAAVLFVVTAALTGTLWGQDGSLWGAGPVSILTQGHWWSLVTAFLVPASPIGTLVAVLLSLTVLADAEHRLGHRRVLWLGAAIGVGGIACSVTLHALSWLVTSLEPFEAAEISVLDPALVIVGVEIASSAFASALWRRRIRVTGFVTLIVFALYAGGTDDWYRLGTAIIGLIVGVVMARHLPRRSWHRSSTREIRTLVAVSLAVTALGPLVSLASGVGRGPLSQVARMFAQYDEKLVDLCTEDYRPAYCDHEFVLVITKGLGPSLLALVPLLLALIAAFGLLRGRRSAWLLAVGVEAALGALGIWQLAADRVSIDAWTDGSGLEYLFWGIASIGFPCVLLLILILTRRRFALRATPRSARILAIVLAVVFLWCVGAFVIVGELNLQAFDVAPTIGELLVAALRRFVPATFLAGLGEPPFPLHGTPLFAFQWIGVLFWAVVIVGVLQLYRSTATPTGSDGRQYRTLLRRYGGTLGQLGTWRGNRYWYGPDGESAVAYRLVGDVALAVADPLAPTGQEEQTMRGFVDACVSQNWTPAFYSIHSSFLPAFDAMGWSRVSVGEETVMPLPGLSFAGKAWQNVRHPLTRAEREGVRAEWTSWAELDFDRSKQLLEIDEQWVADKALPELGFTLGGLEELRDPDVALLLAVDEQGRILAVTSWMPCWRDERLIGWTLDFMRRRIDSPNGMMEFLIASAALRMRDEGLELLSLSGAPLATLPENPPPQTMLSDFLGWLAKVLEPAYGFASLFRFKRKFRPEYRTLYLAYRDPVELPRIGWAVTRAYLPELSFAGLVALTRGAFKKAGVTEKSAMPPKSGAAPAEPDIAAAEGAPGPASAPGPRASAQRDGASPADGPQKACTPKSAGASPQGAMHPQNNVRPQHSAPRQASPSHQIDPTEKNAPTPRDGSSAADPDRTAQKDEATR